MTSRERLKAALSHREGDRIPYDLAGTTVTSISGTAWNSAMGARGLPVGYDDSKTVDIISQIIIPPAAILDRLGVDTRRIGANRVQDLEQSLQRNGNERVITDQYGCRWKMAEGRDYYFNQTFFPLEQYDDLKEAARHLSIPDPAERKEELFALYDSQLPPDGDYALIADRNTAGLLEMYLRFRGYGKGYMDMALDPPGFMRIIERMVEYKMRYWDIFGDYIASRGLEDRFLVASESEDLGTQQSLLVSHQMMRELLFPAMKKYIGFLKKKIPGVRVFFHSCGAIRPIIPDLIEIGIDILNPVQYTASGMEPAALKRDFGSELVFWGGGIDTQGVLAGGTVQQVRDEVRKNIDIFGPGGGFVFAPVHNIQEDVPAENFWAMWEAREEFSRY